MLADLRHAFRVLANTRRFTVAAVLCASLGIGATTAIFSVVNAVLLRPLPYADSDRMVRIFTEFPTFPNGGLRHFWVSPPELLDLRRELTSWESIEAWATAGATILGSSEPLRVTEAYLTGGLMPMLGVPPRIGRTIAQQDDRPDAPLVAVLSYGLWQRAYGGDPGVLGRDIRVDGKPCRVVGVMPSGFVFPPGESDPVELWLPAQIDPARPGGRGSHFLSLVGKLRGGVSMQQARQEITRMVARWGARATPNFHSFDPTFHTVVISGFRDEVVKNVRVAMLVLLGAVVLVLLISTVNVANLLLVRAEGRRREIAVRKAVGAGISRLAAQFAVEGLLLSLLGAGVGLALAFGGLKFIVATNAGSIPRIGEVTIDWRVLVFTIAVTCVTGVLFAMAPLSHVITQNVHETLKSATGRASSAAGAGRFRGILVVSELGLALALLIGAGLMVKAFWRLQQVDVGVDPRNLLTERVSLPEAVYAKPESRLAFWSNLRSRVARLPGVAYAGTSTGLPPNRRLDANDTEIEGYVKTAGGPQQNVDFWNIVSPRYFEAAGIPLVEGRYFDQRDGREAPPAVVINRTMAHVFYGNRSPIGRRLRPGFEGPWRTIVGVVADVKNGGVDRPTGTELYIPREQMDGRGSLSSYLLVRSSVPSARLVSTIRSVIRDMDDAAAISQVRPMDDVLTAARSRPRFLTILLTLFASVAAVLAATGIYGVISFSVAQRTSEIGVRMALGARRVDVVWLVLKQGLALALAGAVFGAAAALAITRSMQGLLFGVSAFDMATFLTTAIGLIAIAAAACVAPASRAAAVDPVVALKYE